MLDLPLSLRRQKVVSGYVELRGLNQRIVFGRGVNVGADPGDGAFGGLDAGHPKVGNLHGLMIGR